MFKPRLRDLLLLPFLAGIGLSLTLAFLVRFEFALPAAEQRHLLTAIWIFVPVKAAIFYVFGVPRISWKVASMFDLLRITAANTAASAAACAASMAIIGPAFPRSIYIIDGLICFLISAGGPFARRLYGEVLMGAASIEEQSKNILVYGAGAAGMNLAKEVRSNGKLGIRVLGFLDDDPAKRDTVRMGIPILGVGRDAARLVAIAKRRGKPVSEIVIAMPSASGKEMRTAIANCRSAAVRFRTVPSLGEILESEGLTSQIRDVSVNDLLGREPISVDDTIIAEALRGKVVLITGGCGSIGSELCRQVARFEPRKLVIFDQAESELFMLAMELRNRFPSLSLAPELGDITRERRVQEVMMKHSVEAVFHAAAYKHVPMMEANIIEAVENNIIGTYNVAHAAARQGVKRFVMISSDKAVHPSSIMGITKRIAELIVSSVPSEGGNNLFVSVRFGNVLASAGSVVQVFQRQIAAGGPVTVTHPEMRRYFMSIPEAVQLVLQASAMGKGSEIFVLDMGQPVRILDLARNMIRLAGRVPDEDIQIQFTGLRPGEKLFEELRLEGEEIVPTYHEKIKIFRLNGPTRTALAQWLETLRFILEERTPEDLEAHLVALVPRHQSSPAKVKVAAEKAAATTTIHA